MPFSAGGDFTALLRSRNLDPFPQLASFPSSAGPNPSAPTPIQATTVLGFPYRDGLVIAGDRRATAGNLIIYDRADKVIQIDPETVMAIAGTPATAFEMARVLEHSFLYYRRSQLQPLSLEAKVRSLGRLLKDNMGLTLQGVGIVVPILGVLDATHGLKPSLFFYDALGAQFQAVDFAVSGSGSGAVRSILHYLNRWSDAPTLKLDERGATRLALQLLDVAAESDTATGGIDRRTQVFPQVMLLRPAGIHTVPVQELSELFTPPS